MTLIDEIKSGVTSVKFYFGIDMDRLINHPKDGSDGLIVCFVKDYDVEEKTYNRSLTIDSILDNKEIKEWEMDNSYIIIYQTGEAQEQIYKVVKKKFESLNKPPAWFSGIGNGKINI